MDGILIVNKPKDITSHDVVDFIRRKFRIKKVGHAGTLDPMATGVLVVLVGKYTKFSNLYMACDKEYDATLVLGSRSDTGDAYGRISHSGKDINFGPDEIESGFKKFLGEIDQFPPMYSSVKFKGRKLYEFARLGISVKLSPRRVVINKIDILRIALPEIFFKVACSKGTYIRQLCADIGEDLGCGAYLACLERTRSGKFTLDDATTMDELKNFNSIDLERRLIHANN